MCKLCNGTGNQKIHGTVSVTIKPCPNGCQPNQCLSHPSDAEHPDHCNLCNDTGITSMGSCCCKFTQTITK
ncbi:MAG TPA: hypothetical protein PLD95_02610 [bacterium]|jgi:hypothetical protein|nr:hypothetical protein [bacterium]HOG38342.1 hypothetical protein [bacterium]HQI03244.1 hypothetical protein [bacterium]